MSETDSITMNSFHMYIILSGLNRFLLSEVDLEDYSHTTRLFTSKSDENIEKVGNLVQFVPRVQG